ncbi:nicotinate-nucleotide adenylyltransferase [Sedimentibacter sp. zth1]|uniref:nicotinate-nucleotide adenylyltransferase n=1 Tax=Sedimentibacter sp. zth1 TaxID=2816908 RepID=UPI001A9264AD|nr:nicotinate-nucleotide adenylyltransferase [Sedimentibacter sp. zth1]QSX06969.1 nicotinate-nucleotide adenylyltransferase [Sedimentibacter sp. zth1]
MSTLKYGIMGGTFNPIHYAHLFIAEEVLDNFKLDKILFMPTGTPPHKQNINIDAFHRYTMTKLAVSNNPNFLVSDLEVLNSNVSYSVDTIRKLKLNHPDIEFYFITGTDAILELPTWKEPRELLSLCKFVSVNRPNYVDENLVNKINIIKNNLGGEIFLLNGHDINLSSTQIRQRVREGKTVRYLLPDSVNDYILKNKLYV